MPAVARKTSQKISALNNDPTNTFGTARETNTISELPGKMVALKKALKNISAKAVIKVPKKKQSAYKKILKARGVTKKEKVQAIKVKLKKA